MEADYPDFDFFRPDDSIGYVSGNLPHWRQEGVTYFITFRLADSLPQSKLHELRQEIEATVSADKRKAELIKRMERSLDAGYGSCVLANPVAKSTVEGAFRFFDRDRYWLDEFVVMPNHVHVIVAPRGDYSLSGILHSWKSYTSNRICAAGLAVAPLWQQESFDHIVRSADYMEKFREYIARNRRFAERLVKRNA
jgi:REP element-mobilizing transposase RayT